ncbi:hypothetical protein G5C51_12055 [Streptomyces sp. A7024]|uniref:Integrin-like protein n=1 Tax=Streptomyces coryli TaxID=1128680 RepID=A0A6G4U065_9ACTN|nr:FG-GAP-like repeat-containing protein [Streptomyces coryli]NGN64631.1 hypothetical protein [Streptomyces coryli]
MRRRTIAALAGAALAAAGLSTLPGSAQGAEPAKAYDFNGDGHRDLVAGVSGGTVGGATYAGYVSVVPGSASGPVAGKAYRVSQSSTGVPGSSEQYDRFGAAFESADLNADGYADLVVSAAGEDDDAGRLTILWGAKSGLSGGATIPSGGGFNGYGGVGVVIADVTGDGTADIVSGNDGEEVGSLSYAKGPFTRGTTPAGLTRIDDDMPHFTHLRDFAAGDFNGDGRTDLAVTYAGIEDTGSRLLRGTATGLVVDRGWYDGSWGSSLAAGDVDKDGYADLVYGHAAAGTPEAEQPDEYPVTPGNGGTVRVVYGSQAGPAGTRAPQDITQETPGVPGSGTGDTERQDGFGDRLAVGDIDGDGRADLAIGTPGEDIGAATDAGAVTLLYGDGGAQSFNQGSPGIAGNNEAKDRFGDGLAVRDHIGDGRADLAAGVPGENGNTGRAALLPATADGLTATGSKNFTPAGLGLPADTIPYYFGRLLG